jgi:hypothetical protein
MMRATPFRLALAAAIVAATAACDIFEGNRLAVGTVLHTPAIAGPDGPAQAEVTAANVFFGEHDPLVDPVISPPVGVLGAEVQLTVFTDSVVDVSLADLGDGNYATTSAQNGDLVYRSGAAYRVEIDDFGDLFEIDADQAPVAEPPQGVPDDHGVGEAMVVSRNQIRVAFIEVLRIDGGTASQTWTNRPASTQGLLEVVADPAPWQAPDFEIPGEAFPEAGTYAVVLTTAVRGVPDFNLYSGSGVLVGSAEARTVRVE